jgi:hypothetical protein
VSFATISTATAFVSITAGAEVLVLSVISTVPPELELQLLQLLIQKQ